MREIVVVANLEVQILQGVNEIVAIDVGSGPRLEVTHGEELVIEYHC